ncbi:HCNGP-like protein-domain-containing protein [Paraphysoderma sedebokerense]|nr:HCNGP-like protein-domain-containing protein [Paraphysoderma sedebokerense]
MKGLVHYSDDSSSDEDVAQPKQSQVRQVVKGTQHVKPGTRNGSSILKNQSETEQNISQSNVYSNGNPSLSSAPISSSSTPQLSRDDHTLPTLPYPLPKPITDVSSTLSYPEFLERILFHPPKSSSSLSRSNSTGSLGLSTSQRISLLKRSRSRLSGSGDDMGNGDVNGVEDEWEARKRLCWPIPELEVPGLENYGIPESPGKEVDVGLIEQLQHYLILKASGISFNTSLLSNKSFKNPHIYQKLIKMLSLNEHGSNFVEERLDLEALKEKKEAFADELGV